MLPHKVMHLQKDYRGEVVFRVENQLNRFGRPASPAEVRFITPTAEQDMWDSAVELVYGRFEPFDRDFHETTPA